MIFTAVGVIIAALGDFSFDLFGYSMALTSVFFQVRHMAHLFSLSTLKLCFQAVHLHLNYVTTPLFFVLIILKSILKSCVQTMYLVLVERSGAEDGLSSIELMFYNGFLSLPFLLFLIIATGEFPHSLSLLFDKVSMQLLLRPQFTYICQHIYRTLIKWSQLHLSNLRPALWGAP